MKWYYIDSWAEEIFKTSGLSGLSQFELTGEDWNLDFFLLLLKMIAHDGKRSKKQKKPQKALLISIKENYSARQNFNEIPI